MILIVGGAWQGKLAFAVELAKKAYPLDSPACYNEKREEYEIAEGSRDSFEAAMKCRIIHGLHEYIRRLLKEGKMTFFQRSGSKTPMLLLPPMNWAAASCPWILEKGNGEKCREGRL